MESHRLLTELGRRMRRAREAQGLSLSELARQTAVSRRYLTEAEAGRANLSFLKMWEIAQALHVPLKDWCDLPVPARERIALVGLRGAGKSTIGRRLALALEVPFVELDARVEAAAGLSLGEVFHLHGPRGFHRFEAQALERVLSEGGRVVLAAGGSIVESPENFARLSSACTTIWLRAAADDHLRRVHEQGDLRPMRDRPAAMSELAAILAEREPLYARCDLVVETSGHTADETLQAVRSRIALI